MAATSKKNQKKKPREAPKFNKSSKPSFTAKKEQNDATKSETLGFQMEDDILDFPRGGGSSLSQKERDEIRAEVDTEFEGEERELKTKNKKRKNMQKMSQEEDDDLGSLFGGGITGKLPRYANKITWKHVKIGDIYEDLKVVRVDRGLGLLLEMPTSPVPTPAYVNISDVAEDGGRKREKKLKIRILGFWHLEGVATGTLKAGAFEGSVFTHSNVKPGIVVRVKVIVVEPYQAIVQFPGGIKALCQLCHTSEFELSKPGKKFKALFSLADWS